MDTELIKETIAIIGAYVPKNEVEHIVQVEPADAEKEGYSKPGIALLDQDMQIALGSVLAVALALRSIDKKIVGANPHKKSILQRIRKDLLEEVMVDVWKHLPAGRAPHPMHEKGIIVY